MQTTAPAAKGKEEAAANSRTIIQYIEAMQVEINSSQNYKDLTIGVLTKLSRYYDDRLFAEMKREDIISYLNSIRKTDEQDSMHKWIGTYNLYLICITRFLKWFYAPTLTPKERPKPEIIQNIPNFKRKEISVYKPSDLWTQEDDLLFLKWCPSKRDQCYHAISRDLSARPHEILSLHICDIVFKQVGSKQYAEVLVNGKTGTRHLPLIDSLPYLKEWLDSHPQRNNPKAYLICSNDRRFAQKRPVSEKGLHKIYRRYKEAFYPKLLNDPKVPSSDKKRIGELLQKPWNPYIRRHSSLTQKSKFLKETILRQHAGWSPGSQMHLKYVHYFGNESSESILQEYGILPKDNQELDLLKPKQCPNCNEPNRPDQKFCAKCRMVLTYDAYNETLESEKQKQDRLISVEERLNNTEQMIHQLIAGLGKITDQQQLNVLAQSMFSSGILKAKPSLQP